MNPVQQLLHDLNLAQYVALFDDYGADQLADILDITKEDWCDSLNNVRGAHKNRIVRRAVELVTGQSPVPCAIAILLETSSPSSLNTEVKGGPPVSEISVPITQLGIPKLGQNEKLAVSTTLLTEYPKRQLEENELVTQPEKTGKPENIEQTEITDKPDTEKTDKAEIPENTEKEKTDKPEQTDKVEKQSISQLEKHEKSGKKSEKQKINQKNQLKSKPEKGKKKNVRK